MVEAAKHRIATTVVLVAALPIGLFMFNQTGPYPPTASAWLAMPRQAPGPTIQIAVALLGWALAAGILFWQARQRRVLASLLVLGLSALLGSAAFIQAWLGGVAYHRALSPEVEGVWSPAGFGLFAGLLASAFSVLVGCALSSLARRRG